MIEVATATNLFLIHVIICMKIIYITCLLATLCCLPCHSQHKQHGKASFYSKKSTGARTASGQRLHHDSLTCAHRFYPFGTKLKVTNLNNNKSVIVKVIDRGPFGRGRIIDLSWAAAKEIGMISQGIASVKVELLDNPIPFKPEEKDLPRIEFEVAEVGYSFIDKWKNQKENSEKQPTKNNQTNKNEKQQANKTENRTSSNEQKNTTNEHKPRLNEHKTEHKEHKPTQSKVKEQNESSSWSHVFEKIKNWGSDLF